MQQQQHDVSNNAVMDDDDNGWVGDGDGDGDGDGGNVDVDVDDGDLIVHDSHISMWSVGQFLDMVAASNGRVPSDFTSLFETSTNIQYFERNHYCSGGNGGVASLVALSMYKDRGRTQDLDLSTILWNVGMTWFLSKLTISERRLFTALLYHAAADVTSPRRSLIVPSEPKDMVAMFTRGQFSIGDNLPMPSVVDLEDGHIYISLFESIRDLFGHGNEVEPILPPSQDFNLSPSATAIPTHSETPRGKEVLHSIKVSSENCGAYPNVIVVEVLIWSDGFEPNNVKQNRGSVWTLFASIGTPEQDVHSGCNTYLVALGPSGADHESVVCKLEFELHQLRQGLDVYCGAYKKILRVHAQIYSAQQDAPERAAFTHVAAGNSTYTALSGYCGDLTATLVPIPSCERCYQSLLDNDASDNTCTSCANWTCCGLKYHTPPDYPSVDGEVPTELVVKAVSFASMRAAAEKTHDMVSTGQWKFAQGKVYLRTEGLQPDLVSLVAGNANNIYKLNKAMLGTNRRQQEKLLAEKEKDSASFEQAVLPAVFSFPGVELMEFIDVIMHLVFLGVVKNETKVTLMGWLKSNCKLSAFVRYINAPQKAIQDLSIAWCKAPPIGGGTFPGAVSENWVANARLLKWMFGGLSLLEATDEEYEDPDIPFEDYATKQISAWLKARNVKAEGRSASVLRSQFERLLSQPGGPPPIPEAIGRGVPLQDVEDLAISMLAMVSRLMVEGTVEESEALDAERHVKIFLSCLERFDKATRKSDEKEVWLTRYNLIRLLNLPKTLLRYGSLRLLWEGDGKGEGALRLLKRLIHGLRGNWALNAAQAYLRERSIQKIMHALLLSMEQQSESLLPSAVALANELRKQFGLDSTDGLASNKRSHNAMEQGVGPAEPDAIADADSVSVEDPEERAQQNNIGIGAEDEDEAQQSFNPRYKDYHRYKNITEAKQAMNDGRIVSFVMLRDSSFCIVLKTGHLLPIKAVEQTIKRCGAVYYKWEHAAETVVRPNDVGIVRYCLLLPLLAAGGFQNKEVFENEFYMITSDWKEMVENFNLSRPRMRQAVYMDD